MGSLALVSKEPDGVLHYQTDVSHCLPIVFDVEVRRGRSSSTSSTPWMTRASGTLWSDTISMQAILRLLRGGVYAILVVVPSVYSIRVVILAVTLISALYKSHAISHSTHLHLGAEVASCVGPGKPRATPSTRCLAPKFQKASLDASGSYILDPF